MFQNLKSWLTSARTIPSVTRPNANRFAPQVEALQDRLTPSAYVANGSLNIIGTATGDAVTGMKENKDFEPIRTRPDYLTFLSEMETGRPPKSEKVPVPRGGK